MQERKRELIDRDKTKFDEDLQRQEELARIESLFAAREEKLRQEEEERKRLEAERQRKEEEERKQREVAEQARLAEEERKRQEEAARLAAEQARLAEEERKRQEEAARQQRSAFHRGSLRVVAAMKEKLVQGIACMKACRRGKPHKTTVWVREGQVSEMEWFERSLSGSGSGSASARECWTCVR